MPPPTVTATLTLPNLPPPPQTSPSQPLASPPRLSFPTPKPKPKPQDVVSWTASIAHHARQGHLAAAAATFSCMLSTTTICPNHVTLLTLLSACADFPSSPLSLPLALSLHSFSFKLSHTLSPNALLLLSTALANFYLKSNLPDLACNLFNKMPIKSSVTYNTMIAGLMRNGRVNAAFQLFDEMPNPDKVSWTALIDGCVKNGTLEQALGCFRAMQMDGVEPDYVTAVAVISACAEIGALGLGLWIHRFVLTREFRENVRVANSLIDMYSRCGRVDFARLVFEGMRKRTLVSWNSMIVGFAVNGRCTDALKYFDAMRRKGFEPDGVTFTGVLMACSHGGLADEGLRYYDMMREQYGIVERVEHYGCLVDLLGRAGRLDEAMRVVERMPMRPNEVVLSSLLAACRMYGDVGMAERLMRYLVELEPEGEANYVLMSNIYAAMGRWDGVGEVRNLMKVRGIKKTPGYSAVEIDCNMHEFVAGDKTHPDADGIYDMLNLLGSEMCSCVMNQ